MFVVYKKNYIF